MFTSEVQFGHAGACANGELETAVAKNRALAETGASVPPTFDQLGETIGEQTRARRRWKGGGVTGVLWGGRRGGEGYELGCFLCFVVGCLMFHIVR